MIFITKKSFNDEIDKRMAEINFRNRMDEDLWKLKDRVNKLEFKVRCLEDDGKVPTAWNATTGSNEVL